MNLEYINFLNNALDYVTIMGFFLIGLTIIFLTFFNFYYKFKKQEEKRKKFINDSKPLIFRIYLMAALIILMKYLTNV